MQLRFSDLLGRRARSLFTAHAHLAFYLISFSAAAQGFTNLGFESAVVVPPGPGTVPTVQAMPGWKANGSSAGNINYNQEWLDTVGVSLLDVNYSQRDLSGFLNGRFCALIQSGLGWGPSSPVAADIEQTGTIPAWARRIVVCSSRLWAGQELVVSFNGGPLPLCVLGRMANPDYLTLAADVSSIAGQTGELKFTRPVLYYTDPGGMVRPTWGSVVLDNIQFSPEALAARPFILSLTDWVSPRLGEQASFTVYATAFPPPAYQWWFNLTNVMGGATNSSLSFTNIQFSQAGLYSVVITNVHGAVTSAPVQVRIYDLLVRTDPQSQTLDAGSTASFHILVDGVPPLSFQWLKDGSALADGGKVSGAWTANLSLSNVMGIDAGVYSVYVTNAYGSFISSAVRSARLTVRDPALTSQPISQSVPAGAAVTFASVAAGTVPLTWQWLFNGSPLPGATGSELRVTDAQEWHMGIYAVVISNLFGSVTSTKATLVVGNAAPKLIVSPNDRTAVAGQSVDFAVMAVGSYPLSYQWMLNRQPIPGASQDTLHLSPIELSAAGAYSVLVGNAFGSVISNPAWLRVAPLPDYIVLHDFANDIATGPWGDLTLSGTTLYGATRNGSNAVYRLETNGENYAALPVGGSDPTGGLVISGTELYGTIYSGVSKGAVFKMKTDGSQFVDLTRWISFGSQPYSGVLLSGTNLYGTTSGGTVFRLDTDGSRGEVLHRFSGYPTDGAAPYGGLVLSGSTLYGTTYNGGGLGPPNGYGIVFAVATNGTDYRVLKHFTGEDGQSPMATLLLSGSKLFGVASWGGASNCGVIFSLNTDGTDYRVLHHFAGPPSDGASPQGTLALSGETLYGTTYSGGGRDFSPGWTFGGGTVFKINTDGSEYCVLKELGGTDGRWSQGGVVVVGDCLYGAAYSGGVSNYSGVVFKLRLPVARVGQLASQTTEAGSTVVLGVPGTTDPSALYQWLFNGQPLGGTSPEGRLELPAVQFSEAGAYSLIAQNAYGAVTSAPVILSVIPPVERRSVIGINLEGTTGAPVTIESTDALGSEENWQVHQTVMLTIPAQTYLDTVVPAPQHRFYRTFQPAPVLTHPSVSAIAIVPALTLAGPVGSSVRIDCINPFGPTDAWRTIDTVLLTNSSQLFFDTSAVGQPPRLWRLVPVP